MIPFRPIIEKYAAKYILPWKMIVAVIETESNFDPLAVSPRGAAGLMQLMPRVVKEFCVKNPFDPDENIGTGCLKLYKLRTGIQLSFPAYGEILDHPWEEGWFLVWACYNYGDGSMMEALKKTKQTFGDTAGLIFQNWSKFIPIETREYVNKISLAWTKYEKTV